MMWFQYVLHLAAAVILTYLYFGRRDARTEAVWFEKLLCESRRNERSLVDENRNFRESVLILQNEVRAKDQEVFKYSSMAANVRSRVKIAISDLEEAMK